VADGGHYITFVKKSVFAQSPLAAEDNEDWFKFDDDDVSVFPAAGLSMLAGGGALLFLILFVSSHRFDYCRRGFVGVHLAV
jgi:hypothetical protein